MCSESTQNGEKKTSGWHMVSARFPNERQGEMLIAKVEEFKKRSAYSGTRSPGFWHSFADYASVTPGLMEYGGKNGVWATRYRAASYRFSDEGMHHKRQLDYIDGLAREKGISQFDFRTMINVKRSTVGAQLTARCPWGGDTLQRICEILGTTEEEIEAAAKKALKGEIDEAVASLCEGRREDGVSVVAPPEPEEGEPAEPAEPAEDTGTSQPDANEVAQVERGRGGCRDYYPLGHDVLRMMERLVESGKGITHRELVVALAQARGEDAVQALFDEKIKGNRGTAQ